MNDKNSITKERIQSSLQNILTSLETTIQVRPEVEIYINNLITRLLKLSRDYYSTFIFMLTTNLSFHQRLILMYLIKIYPQDCSATDLARKIGISTQSKSIYRDLKLLKEVDFIRFNVVHPRLRLVQANNENYMIGRMIELAQIHGKLQNASTESVEEEE